MNIKLSEYLQANLNEAKSDVTNLSDIEKYLDSAGFEYIDGEKANIDYDFTDSMVFDSIMDDDYWNYTKAEYSKIVVYFLSIGCTYFYKLMYKKSTGKLSKAMEWFNDEAEAFELRLESENISEVVKNLLNNTK